MAWLYVAVPWQPIPPSKQHYISLKLDTLECYIKTEKFEKFSHT